MRRVASLGLSLLALVSLTIGPAQAASSNKTLATITGIVTDNKGNPLSGALVSLLREGGVKPVGVDASPSQIEVLRKHLPSAEVYCADGLTFMKEHPGEFHALFCTDVLVTPMYTRPPTSVTRLVICPRMEV